MYINGYDERNASEWEEAMKMDPPLTLETAGLPAGYFGKRFSAEVRQGADPHSCRIPVILRKKGLLNVCPDCGGNSLQVRGTGSRNAYDIPWGGKGVWLYIQYHEYRCTACGRESITDTFSPFIRNKAAYTTRMEDLCAVLGSVYTYKASARIIRYMIYGAPAMLGIIGADKVQACCEMYERSMPETMEKVRMVLGPNAVNGKKRRMRPYEEQRTAQWITGHLKTEMIDPDGTKQEERLLALAGIAVAAKL